MKKTSYRIIDTNGNSQYDYSILPLFYRNYQKVNIQKVQYRGKTSIEHNSNYLIVGYLRKPISNILS
jgi:hypothetical protein